MFFRNQPLDIIKNYHSKQHKHVDEIHPLMNHPSTRNINFASLTSVRAFVNADLGAREGHVWAECAQHEFLLVVHAAHVLVHRISGAHEHAAFHARLSRRATAEACVPLVPADEEENAPAVCARVQARSAVRPLHVRFERAQPGHAGAALRARARVHAVRFLVLFQRLAVVRARVAVTARVRRLPRVRARHVLLERGRVARMRAALAALQRARLVHAQVRVHVGDVLRVPLAAVVARVALASHAVRLLGKQRDVGVDVYEARHLGVRLVWTQRLVWTRRLHCRQQGTELRRCQNHKAPS